MTTSELKKYISNIYQMEITLYTQRKIYNRIQDKINRLGQYQVEALFPLNEVKELNSIGQKILYFIGTIVSGTIIGVIIGILYGVIPCAIIGVILAIFTPLTLKQGLIGGAVFGEMIVIICSLFFSMTDNKSKKKEN